MNKTFTAEWIWLEETVKNQHVEFVCPFIWSGEGRVTLSVSSAANYAAYVNGKYVSSGQYHDFPEYKVYDEIDITEAVQKGENRLCVIGYAVNENFFWHIADVPGVIFEVSDGKNLLAKSCAGLLCRKARGYISGEVPCFSGQLGYGYSYDFTGTDQWLEGDTAGFIPAVRKEKSRELVLRPIERLKIGAPVTSAIITQGLFLTGKGDTAAGRMQTAFMAHRLINVISEEVYKPVLSYGGKRYEFHTDEAADGMYFVVDLGQESAGYLTFELELDGEATVDIGFGEHLDDLRVRSEISGRNFAMTFYCRKGINRFDDYLKRIGCRYLQFFVHAKKVTIAYAGLRPVEYPLAEKPFQLKDALHQRIYDVAVNTLRLCMHEHYEDCPWREQCQYPMDSRLQILFGYYAFGEYEYPKAALRLMSLRMRADGNLPLCSPSGLDLAIPVFSFVYMTAVREYLERTGDKAFAREVYEKCRITAERYISLMQDGMLTRDRSSKSVWNFYDWTDGMVNNWGDHEIGDSDVEFPAPLNAHFSLAMQSLVYIARKIGEAADADRYEKIYRAINEKLDAMFWDETRRLYATYSIGGELSHYAELTQSLIVCCGGASEEHKQEVLRAITQENDLYPITLSMLYYKYEALLSSSDYAEYVKKDIERQWGSMLYRNATTFWETIKGGDDFFYAGSLCHGWSALPIYIYHKYGLGLIESKEGEEYETAKRK